MHEKQKPKRTPSIECNIIRIGEMRRSGAIIPSELRHGSIKFRADSDSPLLIEFIADLRDQNAMFLELRHTEPKQSEPYRINIVEIYLNARSKSRLAMVCPMTGLKVMALYQPPAGTDMFTSGRAHNLLYEADRLDAAKRPLHRLELARRRLERATRPKPPGRGKRGAEAATIARLRAAVAEAEQQMWSAALTKIKAADQKNN